jgi:NAD(P)-dependent dehydrogenase (short-subunit alcohol dehydrogenase family)
MKKVKTVIITGANSGLGLECAKKIAMASNDYKIILACRNKEKAEQAKLEVIAESGNKNIISMELDISSLQSVKNFVKNIQLPQLTPLYGLILNAGISGLNNKNNRLTADGYEVVFGTNHLGNFYLTMRLLPFMQKDGRIAIVSSDMHNPPGGITWPGTKALAKQSEGINIYALSKLCTLYFSYELAARLKQTDRKITINAFNPGLMTDTNLFSDKSFFTEAFLQSVSGRIGSLEASSKELAGIITEEKYKEITSKYIDRGKIIESSRLSYSKENALELWNESVKLSKLDLNETLQGLLD